jgi:ADP-ribose pyrophosphatase YjhB (NUDIX family)
MGALIVKKLAAWLLGWIDSQKPYGAELFNALVRLSPPCAIEAVCLRRNAEGHVEVHLVQRGLDESAYPGHWHVPGSVLRPGETFPDVFRRLEEEEFNGDLVSCLFVDHHVNLKEARGTFVSVVHLCALEGNNLRGRWVRVDQLPASMADHHRNHFIPMALKAFLG